MARSSNWLNPDIGYVRRQRIVEYDIRDAGMSVIRSFGLLSKEKIRRLEGLPKKERAIEVGCIRRDDKEFSKHFGSGMKKVIDAFLDENQIPNERIISIKNDAVYVIGERPTHTKFWECEFASKNEYSSYVLLSGKEFYLAKGEDRVDCKGLGGEVEAAHRDYMVSLIGDVLRVAERVGPRDVLAYLRQLRTDYINMELEVGYYREMNAGLLYRLRGDGMMCYGMKDAPPVEMIDAGYNYATFLVELIARMI